MTESQSSELKGNAQAKASDTSKKQGSLLIAMLAAIGASSCCVGPLLLVSLGVSGAWVSSLQALTEYQPYFIAVTLLFMFLAFRRLYLIPQSCKPGKVCADPKVLYKQRVIFWVLLVFIILLISFPWYIGFFIES